MLVLRDVASLLQIQELKARSAAERRVKEKKLLLQSGSAGWFYVHRLQPPRFLPSSYPLQVSACRPLTLTSVNFVYYFSLQFSVLFLRERGVRCFLLTLQNAEANPISHDIRTCFSHHHPSTQSPLTSFPFHSQATRSSRCCQDHRTPRSCGSPAEHGLRGPCFHRGAWALRSRRYRC